MDDQSGPVVDDNYINSLARDFEYWQRVDHIADMLVTRLTHVVQHMNTQNRRQASERADLTRVIDQAESIRNDAHRIDGLVGSSDSSTLRSRRGVYEIREVVVAMRQEIRGIRLRCQRFWQSDATIRPHPRQTNQIPHSPILDPLENVPVDMPSLRDAPHLAMDISSLKEPEAELFLSASNVKHAADVYVETIEQTLRRVGHCISKRATTITLPPPKLESDEGSSEQDSEDSADSARSQMSDDEQDKDLIDVSDEEGYSKVPTVVQHDQCCVCCERCETECNPKTFRPNIRGVAASLKGLQPRFSECAVCFEHTALYPSGYRCDHCLCMSCILQMQFLYRRQWNLQSGTFVYVDVARASGRCPLCRAVINDNVMNLKSMLVLYGRMVQLRQIVLAFHTKLPDANVRTLESCFYHLNQHPSMQFWMSNSSKLNETALYLQRRLERLVLMHRQRLRCNPEKRDDDQHDAHTLGETEGTTERTTDCASECITECINPSSYLNEAPPVLPPLLSRTHRLSRPVVALLRRMRLLQARPSLRL